MSVTHTATLNTDAAVPTAPTLTGGDTSEEKIPDLSKDGNSVEYVETREDKSSEPQNDDAGEDEYPAGIKMIFIILALVLSLFIVALDLTIIATAIPRITDEFKGLDKVGWYGAAFFMTIGGFQSTWGKAYKYFPLKTTFLVCVLIFELGSVLCGAAPNAETLITGRAITGVGAAGLLAGIYTIIGFSSPPKKRPVFTGIMGAAYGCASVIGPLLGGVFADKVTWRWCFYINLPIGGVSAAIILILFQTPKKAMPEKASLREKILQMDPIGAVLMMGATICYILAVQYGGVSHAWHSSVVIGLFASFTVLMVAWLWLQCYQGERSMVSLRLLTNRTNMVMSSVFFPLAGGFYMVLYYIPIYFQSVHGVSPAVSGVQSLPFIISSSIGTIVSSALVTVTGYHQPQLIGGLATTTIGAGLLYMLEVGTSTGKWIGYQIVFGLGCGCAFQIPMIAVQASAAPSDLAAATGVLLFFQGLGGTFLVSGAQSAFINQLVEHVLKDTPEVSKEALVLTGATEIRKVFPLDQQPIVIDGYMTGLKVVFAMCIAVTGLAFLVSFAMPWKKSKQEKLQNAGGAA